MTFEVSAFASDVPADLLLAYADSTDWEIAARDWHSLTARQRGQTFRTAQECLEPAHRDRVFRDLEACDRLARGGRHAVLMPACGMDLSLRHQLEALPSNRARALALFLHDKPKTAHSVVFERAASLLSSGAHLRHGHGWQGYQLTTIGRDWAPPSDMKRALKSLAQATLAELGEPTRKVEVDQFQRPAGDGGVADDACFTFILDISDAAETDEVWVDDVLQYRPRIPNRKLAFCITPISKVLECGSHAASSELANAILDGIVTEMLGEKERPEKITTLRVRLTGLATRPKFASLPEFNIESVEVKKLVLRRGPGTQTYYVPALSKGDAYDVAPSRINAAAIIAAGLRVVFRKGVFGKGLTTVPFELSLPNRCTLREGPEKERFVLESCLRLWGLLPESGDDEDDERPLAIEPFTQPLAHLIEEAATPFPPLELQSLLGDGLNTLLDLQVLRKDLAEEQGTCRHCREAHPVRLERTDAGWVGVCPIAGLFSMDDTDRPLLVLDMNALALQLMFSLRLESESPQILIDQTLYKLGACGGAPGWTALFAPRLHDRQTIDQISERLDEFGGLDRGIILSADRVPAGLSFRGRHVVVPIDDVIRVAGGRIHSDDSRIKGALGRSGLGKRQRGRPTEAKLAKQIGRLRKKLSIRAGSQEEEVDAICQTMRQNKADLDLPEYKTIRYTWLSDHLRDWSAS